LADNTESAGVYAMSFTDLSTVVSSLLYDAWHMYNLLANRFP